MNHFRFATLALGSQPEMTFVLRSVKELGDKQPDKSNFFYHDHGHCIIGIWLHTPLQLKSLILHQICLVYQIYIITSCIDLWPIILIWLCQHPSKKTPHQRQCLIAAQPSTSSISIANFSRLFSTFSAAALFSAHWPCSVCL